MTRFNMLVLCVLAFGFGFFLFDFRVLPVQATPNDCTLPDSNDAYCSKWRVTKMLNDDLALNGFSNGTDMIVGPADWEVQGKIKQNGTVNNYTENWMLTKVNVAYKSNLNKVDSLNQSYVREGTSDSYAYVSGGTSSSGYMHAVNRDTGGDQYGSHQQGKDNWGPSGLYGLFFLGANGEPTNSQTRTYFPVEWTVSGTVSVP